MGLRALVIGVEGLGNGGLVWWVGETYRRVLRTSVWLFMGSGMGRLIFRHLGHSFRHLVNLAKGWFGLRIGLVDSASTKLSQAWTAVSGG